MDARVRFCIEYNRKDIYPTQNRFFLIIVENKFKLILKRCKLSDLYFFFMGNMASMSNTKNGKTQKKLTLNDNDDACNRCANIC